MGFENEDKSFEFSRRSFLKGGAAIGAAALGGAALAGCAPTKSQGESTKEEELNEVTARLKERASGADLPDAAPILPVSAPDSWNQEVDVVVVGTGGAGLAATTYLAQQGYSVVALEKQSEVGGATRHGATYAITSGGTRDQNAIEFALPTYPLDPHAFSRMYQIDNQYSVDQYLIENIVSLAGEATDWLIDQDGVQLQFIGGVKWHDADIVEGKQNVVFGMENTVNAMEQNAIHAGAEIKLQCACETLVSDGDRVLGVKALDSDGQELFIKANMGVILCAGGMGMNKDLIKAYLPSAWEGVVQGGPMPYHTGEAFRMGLGVGADYSGYDSWSCWESAIDEETSGGDGSFWHYFWHGERQLFHNPWLIINVRGQRVPYYAQGIQPDYPSPGGQMGDMSNCSAWMSQIGHRVYSICDSTFPDTVFKMNTTAPDQSDRSRIPLTDPDLIIEPAKRLVSADWLGEVEEAVERGAVKKADTLEELASQLGLDSEVVVDAVERWNALCERGEDDELACPYDASWLNPVKEPPYYAAILGGQIGKTMCGLRVDERFQVMKSDGKAIPGLYAAFSTAGGLSGEANYGCPWNSTLYGGVAMTWTSGYIAAKMLMENEDTSA